jgi:hypothetical protein
VNVDGLNASISAIVTKFGDFISLSDAPTIANDDLVDYLKTHPSAFALRIKKGQPLSTDSAAHVSIGGGTTYHVLSAKVFDE